MKQLTLAQIDPNFAIPEKVAPADLKYYDPTEEPFRVYGLILPTPEENYFHRMPTSVAAATNPGVLELEQQTAGGRIRFCTDSPYVVVRVSFPKASHFAHMPKTGSAGLDLYEAAEDGTQRYVGTFIPRYAAETGFESMVKFPGQGMHRVTINMPSYNRVSQIQIGLSGSAKLEKAPDYRYERPVVFYGSSITQGGCASRPGNAYTSLLCRNCDCNYINLGFSGSGKGETVMAEYIAGLDMSVFVMDYDHNAPTPEHLQATHQPFFKIIREKKPDLPILMVTRPKLHLNAEDQRRWEIIRTTYENAVEAGDKNVYFVDGNAFFRGTAEEGATVDNSHPNDLGFWAMAKYMEPILRQALEMSVER
ncbi:MAG: SGNH/GDSL hydrolase family protein [Clostridia bacterium]|nr:SGNH/GDSL hydrolase family protein [Clostridia bacterium]